jgi:hypothetical protein
MLTVLKNIVEVFLNIPGYILYAIETIINLLFAGVQGLFALITIIPLPSEPAVPELIGEINWFFPIGAVVSIMAPIVVGYGAFLLVRWLYAKLGDL